MLFSCLDFETAKQKIESSSYIIVCLNEKFRRSERAQFEVSLAKCLSKTLIPLVIQDGFDEEKIEGWLGSILKNIRPVNLIRNDFDESVDKILFEYLKTPVRKDSVTSVDSIQTVDSFELEELGDSFLKNKRNNVAQAETKDDKNETRQIPLIEWDEKMVLIIFTQNGKINRKGLSTICLNRLFKQMIQLLIQAKYFLVDFPVAN